MAIKYKFLVSQLESFIQNSAKRRINKLPTEQELCDRYHVSRQTVRMALSILEQKGLITRKQGSGAFLTGLSLIPRKNTIGILVSSKKDYIYPGVLHDIRNGLSLGGFSMETYTTGNCVSTERDILLSLLKDPPGGLIVEGSKSALPNPNLDLYRKLFKKDCPVVFLHNYYPALADSLFIKDDNLSGSALLVQYLASQGHKSIGGIFKSDDMQGPERYQGFMETMRSLKLPVPDSQICWFNSKDLDHLLQERDTHFLGDMVKSSLSSCTAVVCYNDLIAYYLIEVLMDAGYRLPADMAIAAFDNTYLSNSDILTVTTLSHIPHEMGTRAAEMMIHKKNGLPVTSQETRWVLNLKESTMTDA